MYQVKFIDLGLKDYKETWDYQQDIQNQLLKAKAKATVPDILPVLIFVEHPHVYTLGKSGKENNLLIAPGFLTSIGATFYRIDRGGDITYHGPGQLVVYPVFDLDPLGIGVKKYIEDLEESVILTLREFGIQGKRLTGATGVWIDSGSGEQLRKICAIGVKISRGITMHGFALNVATNLQYFSYINPCGFDDKGVTSMEKEMALKPDINHVKRVLLRNISGIFGVELS
jgi:lipoyl(octanoyl) transferase